MSSARYSGDLRIPVDAFAAGLGDLKIVTTLCPGDKERMRRLMEAVSSGRADLKPLVRALPGPNLLDSNTPKVKSIQWPVFRRGVATPIGTASI